MYERIMRCFSAIFFFIVASLHSSTEGCSAGMDSLEEIPELDALILRANFSHPGHYRPIVLYSEDANLVKSVPYLTEMKFKVTEKNQLSKAAMIDWENLRNFSNPVPGKHDFGELSVVAIYSDYYVTYYTVPAEKMCSFLETYDISIGSDTHFYWMLNKFNVLQNSDFESEEE